MASYPHYRIGDSRPEDKLLILEDTNNDGRGYKQTVFAMICTSQWVDRKIWRVRVAEGSLVFLRDTDGDDKYDTGRCCWWL